MEYVFLVNNGRKIVIVAKTRAIGKAINTKWKYLGRVSMFLMDSSNRNAVNINFLM